MKLAETNINFWERRKGGEHVRGDRICRILTIITRTSDHRLLIYGDGPKSGDVCDSTKKKGQDGMTRSGGVEVKSVKGGEKKRSKQFELLTSQTIMTETQRVKRRSCYGNKRKEGIKSIAEIKAANIEPMQKRQRLQS